MSWIRCVSGPLQRLKSGGEMIEDFEETGDDALREKLSENEKIMRQMSETWEEKLQKTGTAQFTETGHSDYYGDMILGGCIVKNRAS